MSLGALNVSYYISALRKKQAVKGRIFNGLAKSGPKRNKVAYSHTSDQFLSLQIEILYSGTSRKIVGMVREPFYLPHSKCVLGDLRKDGEL